MPDTSNERTPLIQVVRVEPPRQRYPHQNVRRFCTLCLSAILLIAVVIYLLFLFVIPDCEELEQHGHHRSKVCLSKHPLFRNHNHDHNQDQYPATLRDDISYDDLLDILVDTPDEKKIREWSEYYTSGPHLAGKNKSQAEWTKDKWIEFGVAQTHIVTYDIYASYPLSHRLALMENSNGSKEDDVGSKKKSDWKVKYEAGLEEDVLKEDRTSGLNNRIPTFHGYGASGNVTASYVFCNYGTYPDFEDLLSANVTLQGKIALIKYGRIFRGLKVKRAQELGMIGVVMYSDPGDDGEITEENGFKAYPKGPARNPSSVQRGSVQFLSIYPGDPTTPEYPSKPGAPRLNPNATTPVIPSIPISYQDALPLLTALNGHGPRAKSFNKYWQGGGLGYKGVKYYIGPTPADVVLNLVTEQEYVITPMWNVIGIINGTLSDEVVIIGNHRDAWIAGGAGDPNSGSASLNEVVRSYGAALDKGWKPLRTILFASWDGEEYGLLGSTEWVEDYVAWLGKTAVAYLNVDVAAAGHELAATAAPLLSPALIESTKLVLSPNQTRKGQTLYDLWDKRIKTVGSGSDFTAFQDFAGIPSVDLGFKAGRESPVYHYHSNYDSFDWMDHFGDKGWRYHVTMSRLWAVLAAKIVETAVLPFNATFYAQELNRYLQGVEGQAKNMTFDKQNSTLANEYSAEYFKTPTSPNSPPYDFAPLKTSLERLLNASTVFDTKAARLQRKVQNDPPSWWHWWERVKLYYAVRRVNDKYKLLERQFLSKGYDKRPWFKHVVFAPGIWTGYSGETYPPLKEAIEDKNVEQIYKWTGIINDLVAKAAELLED